MTGTVKEWRYLIEVHITQNSLTVKGHAGYAERGKDIYCSAVSVLTQGLLHSMDAFTDDDISVEVGDGYIGMRFENLSEKGKLLIDSFFITVTDIQKACDGKYVAIV